MFEEIKKEINKEKILVSEGNYCMKNIYDADYVIDVNKVFEILDKYNDEEYQIAEKMKSDKALDMMNSLIQKLEKSIGNNQPDYKSAWEELKVWFDSPKIRNRVVYGRLEWIDIKEQLQEISKKHNLRE